MSDNIKRPECFEFAMSFIGGEDEADIRAYVKGLELAIGESLSRDVLEWGDGDTKVQGNLVNNKQLNEWSSGQMDKAILKPMTGGDECDK